MNLYLIKRPNRADYDEYECAVVCALTPEEAQHIHPCGDASEFEAKYPTWVKPEEVKVIFLGVADYGMKTGVICASFNAG